MTLSYEREVTGYAALLEDDLTKYQRLSRMIDSMLFLTRADATAVELNRVPIESGTELPELTSYFAVLDEDKGVKAKVSMSGSVSVDPTIFRRAIDNLLSSAVHHADNSSVASLNCRRDEDSVAVHVLN